MLHMDSLTPDLARLLVSLLPARALAALAQTCRLWRDRVSSPLLWSRLLASSWPLVPMEPLVVECGPRAAYRAMWSAQVARLRRAKLQGLCVALVGSAQVTGPVLTFLRGGDTALGAAPSLVPLAAPESTVTLLHGGRYATYVALEHAEPSELLAYDVVLLLCADADPAAEPLHARTAASAVLAPVVRVLLAAADEGARPPPGVTRVQPGSTALFKLLTVVVWHSTSAWRRSCDDGDQRYPWVSAALEHLHRWAAHTRDGHVPEWQEYFEHDLVAADAAFVSAATVRHAAFPAALLHRCGFGDYFLLHSAVAVEDVNVDDALSPARSALAQVTELVALLTQARHPWLWPLAVGAARRWLQHVVATARAELAERVGLPAALRLVCERHGHSAHGRFAAVEALRWAVTGELGRRHWGAVAANACRSARTDVVEQGEALAEIAALWDEERTVAHAWMEEESEAVVLSPPCLPPTLPPPAPPAPRVWLWWWWWAAGTTTTLAVVLWARWLWMRRRRRVIT